MIYSHICILSWAVQVQYWLLSLNHAVECYHSKSAAVWSHSYHVKIGLQTEDEKAGNSWVMGVSQGSSQASGLVMYIPINSDSNAHSNTFTFTNDLLLCYECEYQQRYLI